MDKKIIFAALLTVKQKSDVTIIFCIPFIFEWYYFLVKIKDCLTTEKSIVQIWKILICKWKWFSVTVYICCREPHSETINLNMGHCADKFQRDLETKMVMRPKKESSIMLCILSFSLSLSLFLLHTHFFLSLYLCDNLNTFSVGSKRSFQSNFR